MTEGDGAKIGPASGPEVIIYQPSHRRHRLAGTGVCTFRQIVLVMLALLAGAGRFLACRAQADRPASTSSSTRVVPKMSKPRSRPAGPQAGQDRASTSGPVPKGMQDLLTIRQRLVERFCQDPDAKAAEELAVRLQPDGSWPDIDYANTNLSAWGASGHLSRLQVLAEACKSKKSPPRGQERLSEAALAALDHWLQKDYHNANWWWTRIGVPMMLGPTLLLMENRLSDVQRAKGLEILRRTGKPDLTGENTVWLADAAALRAVIERGPAALAGAYRKVAEEIRISDGEGIQADYSFHQHGPLLYNMGYGANFGMDCARVAALLDGTDMAFAPEKVRILTHYILDGQQWFLRGVGHCDYGAIGREVARDSEYDGYIRTVCRDMLKLRTGREKELRDLADRVSGKPGAVPLEGNRHFWRGDIMAHHRRAYYASVRMYSTRTLNNDGVINGEGGGMHHIADGCNYLFRRGDEYAGIFAAWDWMKVPGTTVEQRGRLSDRQQRRGEKDFVGGVSDGTYGLAAFDFARDRLSARKAWFFFDAEYVCLGAGITCDSDNAVVTTFNQCHLRGDVTVAGVKLKAGDHEVAAPGWVHHDQVAYVFLQPGKARLRNDVQSGDRKWIDRESPSRPVRLQVFRLWLDHGTRPKDATYAYVVAPAMPAGAAGEYAADLPVEIPANTPALQAVRHKALGIAGAAFYEPGRLEIRDGLAVSVDRSCLLLLRETPKGYAVSLANPRNAALTVRVRIEAGSRTLEKAVTLPDGMLAGSSATTDLP